MSKEFQTIALVGLIGDVRVAEPMSLLADYLTKAGREVVASEEIAAEIAARAIREPEIAANADLIIAVGGDGTMLYAADLAGGGTVPLLGVNRGRLGFLTDVLPADMLESLDRVLGGDYVRESRLLLEGRVESADGSSRVARALNDVVVHRRESGRMLDLETRIAGRYVNTHSGDGLVVATPTGSTAYALSCGGPIIEPVLDVVVLVPVCPHTLSDRPIVVPASQEIEVLLLDRQSTKAEVTADARSLGIFEPGERLTISAAPDRVTLIHPPGHDFYEILRSKLHWGHDTRWREPKDS